MASRPTGGHSPAARTARRPVLGLLLAPKGTTANAVALLKRPLSGIPEGQVGHKCVGNVRGGLRARRDTRDGHIGPDHFAAAPAIRCVGLAEITLPDSPAAHAPRAAGRPLAVPTELSYFFFFHSPGRVLRYSPDLAF